MTWRRTAAVLALLAVAATAAVLLATGSSSTSTRSSLTLGHFNAVHEGDRSNQGEDGEAAAEAYSDRAYPADGISIDQIQAAISARTTRRRTATSRTRRTRGTSSVRTR